MDVTQYRMSVDRLKQLRAANNLPSYAIMGFNFALLALACGLLSRPSLGMGLAGAFVLAIQMNHAYLIVHECGHNTFVSNSRANEILGNLFALFALLPYYARQHEHSLHHRYTGTFNEPSTNRAMNRFSAMNPATVFFLTICWKLWIPAFSFNEHVMLWGLPFEAGGTRKARAAARIAMAVYAVLIAATLVWGGIGILLKFLLASYIYMVMIEFFNLPHHLASPIEDRPGSVPYYEQSHFSRSCAPLPAPFGALFVLNFNYHIAHHLYPYVHWTNLKEAHVIMTGVDPSLGVLEPEFKINVGMRRQPFRVALQKYFEHQLRAEAA